MRHSRRRHIAVRTALLALMDAAEGDADEVTEYGALQSPDRLAGALIDLFDALQLK